MYTTSVPIALESMRENALEQDLAAYLDYFERGKIKRVFIAALTPLYADSFAEFADSEKLKKSVEFFGRNGLEVGVWLGGFGHGSSLAHDASEGISKNYIKLTGVGGECFEHGYCPSDENFVADYLKYVKKIASLNPDLIMIDDDFRLNLRSYYFGCFCERHLKEFYRLTGEVIPREKIEELIFCGGKNKYRDAYLEMSKNALMNFAKKVREATDEINPKIRVGFCAVPTTWDFDGTDVSELAKTFAGKNTKPFLRTFGAPYHNQYNIIQAVERERMQFAQLKRAGDGAEIFAEGDLYPRPRYNVNSKCAELFDLAIRCDGNSDGILKYMFDYTQKTGYETGYIEKHIKGLELAQSVAKLFENKRSDGIFVFEETHKIRKWELPLQKEEQIAGRLYDARFSSVSFIAENSVPTCYCESEFPVAVFGENARYVSEDMLKNGAVLDVIAAKILKERGIDVGLLNCEKASGVAGEYYSKFDDEICGIGGCRIYSVTVESGAEVLSWIMPQKTAGAYRYENKDGVRFLVFAADFYFSNPSVNYFKNYYRQKQLTDGLEWVGKKKLPAVCEKHPNLYIMAAKGESSESVLLINSFPDDIEEPKIKLGGKYRKAKFINCTGTLDEDAVTLSDIAPYGFAAFEAEM